VKPFDYYIELIIKESTGDLADSERHLLSEWLKDSENKSVSEDLRNSLNAAYSQGGHEEFVEDLDPIPTLLKVEGKIKAAKKTSLSAFVDVPYSTNFFLKALPWAAAIVIGFYFLLRLYSKPDAASEPTEWLSKTTPNGIQEKLVLSDSSVAWLNGGSIIKYPKVFSNEKREVEIAGEVYFEVKKSELPFIVKTGQIMVTVKGTAFVVSVNSNTDVRVAVVEGKVGVSNKSASIRYPDLLPDQRLIYKDSLNIVIDTVAASQLIPWLTKKIVFEDERMDNVAISLKRYFGVEVEVKGSLKNCQVSGDFSGLSLEDVITSIAYTIDASYSLQAGKYIISGQGCAQQP
jgi:transmembrane sensor